MINAPKSKVSSKLKCSICRADIKDRHKIYQSSLKLGIICHLCRQRFSNEDIEMMINLFFAFGEYFGAHDRSKFSIKDIILEFAIDLNEGKANFQSQNVKMWHKVLTHGITPHEFLEELSVYVEQD
ncbi:MAG: hypothetical protein HWN80_04745 [Candidatus Lokiarchaeota archaeon]|nr:hypothetical protein [Candidatus Lokiarchaeota archaeon]